MPDWARHARLRAAFADNWRAVRSLRWKGGDRGEWYSEPGWGLSTHALVAAVAAMGQRPVIGLEAAE